MKRREMLALTVALFIPKQKKERLFGVDFGHVFAGDYIVYHSDGTFHDGYIGDSEW